MEGNSGVRKGIWKYWYRRHNGCESSDTLDGEEDWLEGKGPTYMEWSEEKRQHIYRDILTGPASVRATFFPDSGGPPIRYQRTADSSASAPLASQENPSDVRDWSQLPGDVLLVIFKKLGVFNVLKVAEHVCRTWRAAAKDDPALWHCVDMRDPPGSVRLDFDLLDLARIAVDRSGGRAFL